MTHEPNTPRTHNSKGQKVSEPVQCIVCLQAWPCEVARLTEENANLLAINRGLMRKVEEAWDKGLRAGQESERVDPAAWTDSLVRNPFLNVGEGEYGIGEEKQ